MIIDTLVWFIVTTVSFVWFIFSTFWSFILIGIIVCGPLVILSKMKGDWHRMEKPIERKYRLTPQEPAVYYNSFGHLVKVDPVPGSEDEIRQYFKDLDMDETDFRGDTP
jgi:hypothetical protein